MKRSSFFTTIKSGDFPVLDKPHIFFDSGCWWYVSSASRHRNIRAGNFCIKQRKKLPPKEVANAAPQQTTLL